MQKPKINDQFQRLFLQKSCWTIDNLCHALEYSAISVRRFLKEIGYYNSFTHNGKWYTLSSIPTFNRDGLWFFDSIGFSMHGNLKQTILFYIDKSPEGLSAKALESKLSIPCHAVLNHLYKSGKTERVKGEKGYVYLSTDESNKSRQLFQIQRRLDQTVKPQSLSPLSAVYVLAEYIRNPQASYVELSKAVAHHQVIAPPEAIARLFKEHDLKKTPN
ncbi:MAG: hypothetical protein JW976_08995 [Syntrophaceae bacterium]|nr:hypothetical protein [Syntrophaceae bacterium]